VAKHYYFQQPTMEDIKYLADHLRPEDRREIAGMTGADFLTEIRHCVASSACCWSCLCDGQLLAIFGVICTNPFRKHGIIWMLSTEHTVDHKMYAGRMTRKGLNAILQDWEYLYNYVDEGNNRTIAWLKWMGAKVYPPRPRGLYGYPYHLFTFKR